MRILSRRFVAAVLLCLAWPLLAAPPATITYQGTLGTASGQAVNQSIGVTFRLYDTVAGGAPLWSESQTVAVGNGKFAVELGAVEPLVPELFAQPLFLGIVVAGDVEMTPRLPLTAAPYAIRAKALLRNTIHVSSDGTPQANAATLRAAVGAIMGASSDNRYEVMIDAGEFDLGNTALLVPSFVALRGASARTTTLVASVPNGALQLQSDSGISTLGVVNYGSGGDFAVPTSAIEVLGGTRGVRIRSVSATSMPPAGTQGVDVRAALRFTRSSDLEIADVDLRAERSSSIYGLFGTFPAGAEPLETGVVLRDLRIAVGAATVNVRGFDTSGRMELSVDNVDIQVDAGGIDTANVVGFRSQLEVALTARQVDVEIDFAGNAPGELRGLHFNRSAAVDLTGFRMSATTGPCTSGFRNGIVFFNPPAATLLDQAQPRLRDGTIEVIADGCYAGGVYNAGSKPVLDNVRILARQLAPSQTAVGYVHSSGNSSCDAGEVQAGIAVLRHATIEADAVAGATAQGIESCVDGLSVEHSTVTVQDRAFTVLHNTAGSATHRFVIANSRLVSTSDYALGTFSDATGTVQHTSLEGATGATFASPDPLTGTTSTIACRGVTTATTFSAGPACPCTTAPNCPATP